MNPISCADLEPLLPLIADGAVDAQSEPAAFDHLAGCPRCQDALLRHDLVTVALAGTSGTPRRRARPIPWPWILTAAAAVLVVAMGIGWPLGGTRDRAEPVTAASAGIEVLVVPGDRPGTEVTILRRGDNVVVIEPRQLPDDAQPVGFRRY